MTVFYRYSHVHVNSANMPEAVEFYKRMFGAKVVDQFETEQGRITTDLDINGMRLLVSNKFYPLDAPVQPGSAEPHLGLEHFALRTDDLGDAAADLEAKGADFLMKPHEFCGLKLAFVRGPDDVRIEVIEGEH